MQAEAGYAPLLRMIPGVTRPSTDRVSTAGGNLANAMDSGYILVVDDDAPTRLLLRNLLEDDGFSVQAACDGVEAIECCERELPNIMITDLNMPRLGGAELVGELESRGLGSFPVIVISGREDCAQVAEDLSLSSMSKPFDSYRLLQMVRNVSAA